MHFDDMITLIQPAFSPRRLRSVSWQHLGFGYPWDFAVWGLDFELGTWGDAVWGNIEFFDAEHNLVADLWRKGGLEVVRQDSEYATIRMAPHLVPRLYERNGRRLDAVVRATKFRTHLEDPDDPIVDGIWEIEVQTTLSMNHRMAYPVQNADELWPDYESVEGWLTVNPRSGTDEERDRTRRDLLKMLGVHQADKLRVLEDTIAGHGMVIRNGIVIHSWGNVGELIEDPITDWASASKPILATLALVAVASPNYDLTLDTRVGGATLRQLCNQTSGYLNSEAPSEPHDPSGKYAYNDYAVALLAEKLAETFGVEKEGSLQDAVNEELSFLNPGTMFKYRPPRSGGCGGSDVTSRHRVIASVASMARFGWLWTMQGRWPAGDFELPTMQPNADAGQYFASSGNGWRRPWVHEDMWRSDQNRCSSSIDWRSHLTYGGDTNGARDGVHLGGRYGFFWWFNEPAMLFTYLGDDSDRDRHGEPIDRLGRPADDPNSDGPVRLWRFVGDNGAVRELPADTFAAIGAHGRAMLAIPSERLLLVAAAQDSSIWGLGFDEDNKSSRMARAAWSVLEALEEV